LVEGKEKRAGTELAQEITKKQKVEDDKETVEIKKLMEIIQDEEKVTIDAISLAVKSLSIVDWKIHNEETRVSTANDEVTTAHGLQRKYAKCLLLLVHS
ncbi:hypothetical protein Tco_1171603, partial [Tanacetum coccineum]